eukprot:gene5642-11382_t
MSESHTKRRRSLRIARKEANIIDIDSQLTDENQSSNIFPPSIDSKDKSSTHYEFGGPIGSFFIVFGLPLVLYALYFLCNSEYCLANPFSLSIQKTLTNIKSSLYFSKDAAFMYLGWMLFHIILERVLPGDVVEGTELPDGSHKKLKYNINGHLQFWLTLVSMFHIIPKFKDSPLQSWDIVGFQPLLPVDGIYEHYVELITISVIGSFALSIYLKGALLAKGGNTGYAIYDFFIGRELNPRIGTSFDLKEFCELRPGLIGWLAINMGMAMEQYARRGSLSGSMVMGIYVWDALFQEKAILTTMDITTDGFGYMLAFGDLSWVPFVYSFQARYLVDHDPSLSPVMLLAFAAVHWFGFYIFRAANSQKDAFRRETFAVPEDQARHETANIWLVGTRQEDQLHRGLLGDSFLVSAVWLRITTAVLPRTVFRHTARTQSQSG